MDGSINTTASKQRRVGGIHNGIHPQFGDVSKFCSEEGGHGLESLPPPAPRRHYLAGSGGPAPGWSLSPDTAVGCLTPALTGPAPGARSQER